MDVFLYFREKHEVTLDVIEDALDETLRDIGEVTGSGIGESGSNLDVHIDDASLSKVEVIARIRMALGRFAFNGSSRIVIDGEEYQIR